MGLLNSCSFWFNGKNLSEFGMGIGWFGGAEDETFNMTREIIRGEPNMVRRSPNQYGTRKDLLTLSFDIFKLNNEEITYEESRALDIWLNSTGLYQELIFDGYPDDIFYAVCNNITDYSQGMFSGKRLEFECNSPYSYCREMKKTFNLNANAVNNSNPPVPNIKIFNSSDDENDYYYTLDVTGGTSTVSILNITDNTECTMDLSSLPDSYAKIDGKHFMITDKNGKLVPFYKINWGDSKWPHFVPGWNELRVNGASKLVFTMQFARKVGVL